MVARFVVFGGVVLTLLGTFGVGAGRAALAAEEPLLRFEDVDIGWSDFPGGRVLRCAVADGFPVVWEVGDGRQRSRPLSLLPGRVYCDAQFELPPNRHLIWGDNSLWGGAGDLYYNGERVLTLGGGLGLSGLSLGDNARAGGRGTSALGSWNEPGGAGSGIPGEWLFSLGNGTPARRSNAFAVSWGGEGWFAGGLTVAGRVGIGTGEPTAALDVRGQARISAVPESGGAVAGVSVPPALEVVGDVVVRGTLTVAGAVQMPQPAGMGRFQRTVILPTGARPGWWERAGVAWRGADSVSGGAGLNLGQLRYWYLSGLEELGTGIPLFERGLLKLHVERWRSAAESVAWNDYLPVGTEDLRLLASPLLRAARAAAARGQCRLLCEPAVLAPASTAPPGCVPVATVASWFAWERVGAP